MSYSNITEKQHLWEDVSLQTVAYFLNFVITFKILKVPGDILKEQPVAKNDVSCSPPLRHTIKLKLTIFTILTNVIGIVEI